MSIVNSVEFDCAVAVVLSAIGSVMFTALAKYSILSTICLTCSFLSIDNFWLYLLRWDLWQLCHISWLMLGMGYFEVVLFECVHIFVVVFGCILAWRYQHTCLNSSNQV